MAVLIGIDEAGYGPILGPLVLSAASFSVPDELLKADLWDVLAAAVGKTKKGLKGRLLITDSKKAYTRASGPFHLRRSVLAALNAADKSQPMPSDTARLLDRLCPACHVRLGDYPWYQNLAKYNLGADESAVALASTVFGNALKANDMKMLGIDSVCLDVGYYNKMVDIVKNKSTVSFTSICSLIQNALDATPQGEVLQAIVDRQGGRVCYTRPLRKMFPSMDLKIIRQEPAGSSYELTEGDKVMKLHFVTKADLRFLPVSLASLASKYIRELLMGEISGYFVGQAPQIKSTAGYWKDGLRFIQDIETYLPDLQYDKEKLIRSR
jgi:hypothetical protein